MNAGRAMFGFVGIGILLTACEPVITEYRKRPAYYQQAAVGELPDRVVEEDGRIIVYETRDPNAELADDPESEMARFKPREEMEDGSIVLRAVLPDHILANTILCLHNQEYELLYDQLISKRTHRAYREQGKTGEDFAEFCRANRRDLLSTLNRMRLGMSVQDVAIVGLGDGAVRYRLRPHLARDFRFTMVDMVTEGYGLKLLLIH